MNIIKIKVSSIQSYAHGSYWWTNISHLLITLTSNLPRFLATGLYLYALKLPEIQNFLMFFFCFFFGGGGGGGDLERDQFDE